MPGHGALNAALMMDAILGQARELPHAIYVLLDLKQFFPAIKRAARAAAEYFVGLPDEVMRWQRRCSSTCVPSYTAHGMSDGFDILGDLMGCVLSPSHAVFAHVHLSRDCRRLEWSARLGLRQESTARGSNHDGGRLGGL